MNNRFFFIERRVSEKPYLDNAVVFNISVITAIEVKDYRTAIFYIPRVAENYIKYYIAKRGFIPPRGIGLSHLKPSLQDGLTESGKDIINRIYELYKDLNKHRWSHYKDIRSSFYAMRRIHNKLKLLRDLINEL
jgi:HEPN domain-containing protein